MALIVHTRSLEGLEGGGEWMLKMEFRGKTQRTASAAGRQTVYFGQQLTWPIGRPVDAADTLDVRAYSVSTIFSNRLLGRLTISLQQLDTDSRMTVRQQLVDSNHSVLQAILEFEIIYYSPDSRVGEWRQEDFHYSMTPFDPELGGVDRESDTQSLVESPNNDAASLLSEDDDDEASLLGNEMRESSKVPAVLDPTLHKAEDCQLAVTIIEARQLAGANLNPCVEVQVGETLQKTDVQLSTNAPHYNQYFVFHFHVSRAELFDHVIHIRAVNKGRMAISRLFGGHLIGEFRMDVRTVHAAQDKVFFERWACLIDPKQPLAGPKGYVKCTISLIYKGEQLKIPTKKTKETEEEDIDANLLLPTGVPIKRQMAEISVRIYRAEQLPKMNTDLVASIKKAFSAEAKPLADPFVQVSFAGHTAKTQSKKNTYDPQWNEAIVFTELFPPLCNRIRVAVYDWDRVYSECIATHFIDLSQIMSDTETGFPPTFGPCWVNLYGTPRHYTMDSALHPKEELNRGLGEGVAYRGRLLMAVKTEIKGEGSGVVAGVRVTGTQPLPPRAIGSKRDLLLAGVVFDAGAIDAELGAKAKQLQFELSVGTFGNQVDSSSNEDANKGNGQQGAQQAAAAATWCNSLTPPLAACKSQQPEYYHMPYGQHKPCLYIRFNWEFHAQRLMLPNILEKLHRQFDESVQQAQQQQQQQQQQLDSSSSSSSQLQKALRSVAAGADRAGAVAVRVCSSSAEGAGRTQLDYQRLRSVRLQLRKVQLKAKSLRRRLAAVDGAGDADAETFRRCLRDSRSLARHLRRLSLGEQQHSLPDVFVWLLADSRRVAFARLPARRLLHSPHDSDAGGRDCGLVRTVFLRKPGRRGVGQSGWSLQCQLKLQLWLGAADDVADFWATLPSGYDGEGDVELAMNGRPPPPALRYCESSCFQFRAYLFSARNLIGSDDSGLSDAFARVVVKDQVATTHTVPQSLSPRWDRTLLLSPLTFCLAAEAVEMHPPVVLVEIFDEDSVGKPEYLGRSFCEASVQLSASPAQLQQRSPLRWWQVYRGQRPAGQLLAAFELLQLSRGADGQWRLPSTIDDAEVGADAVDCVDNDERLAVPEAIRPRLVPYRVELLFWGVRQLQRVQLQSVQRPRVVAEFGGANLTSGTLRSAAHLPNFDEGVRHLDLMLPENLDFWPPLMFQCEDRRQFGRLVLVGNHVIPCALQFVRVDDQQTDDVTQEDSGGRDTAAGSQGFENPAFSGSEPSRWQPRQSLAAVSMLDFSRRQSCLSPAAAADAADAAAAAGTPAAGTADAAAAATAPQLAPGTAVEVQLPQRRQPPSREDLMEIDWWSRFYASLDDLAQLPDSADSSDSDDLDSDILDDIDVTIEVESEVDDKAALVDIPEPDTAVRAKKNKKMKKKMKKRAKKEKRKAKKQQKLRWRQLQLRKDAESEHLAEKQEQVSVSGSHGNEWISRIKLYRQPLEQVKEFNAFQNAFKTFPLYRGKQGDSDSEDEESRQVGVFKGNVRIYRIAEDQFNDPGVGHKDLQLSKDLPSAEPISVCVRVYVVRCCNLHPADPNGKSDPYLLLRLGSITRNDKDNYIPKTLNPVFGRCFEFDATFPQESSLRLLVMDWDMLSGDDLIGETVIDLEDRFFSHHRATCGLPLRYDTFGSNKWRDQQQPTTILHNLCRKLGIRSPKYEVKSHRVTVNGHTFYSRAEVEDESGKVAASAEPLALAVLHNWNSVAGAHLLSEHVESRPLYSPEKPGMEQGRVDMWVDMFPKQLGPPPPPVDIAPRQPIAYQLRVIVWDTADVILDDVGIMGDPSSDIFVKGWMKGVGIDDQVTDVHYRSLTGEGNFNWRFVFDFELLKAENCLVYRVKDGPFAIDEEEKRGPCQLQLQVWDADIISADDYLGGLQLTLSRLVRGAKSAKACGLFLADTGAGVQRLSLFRNRRCRGWWPFVGEQDGEKQLAGKVDAELQLLTAAEAEAEPAGLGRNEPQPLPAPDRPETSFNWLTSPLKTLRFLVWQPYKFHMLAAVCIVFLLAFFLLFMYSAPGYAAKRLIGA